MSVDLHHVLGGPQAAGGGIGPLARPVRAIDPETACDVVDEAFRTDADLLCLAVRPRPGDATGRWGLVSRTAFVSAMVGRLGYGRSVHAHRPVSVLADWDALVLDPSTSVSRAAELVLRRERTARYSEVLVLGGGDDEGAGAATSFLEVEDVLRALAAELAHKALTDPLTQLANRDHFLQELRLLSDRATSSARQLVLVYVDVDDFKGINDSYGHSTGDQVLQEVADRLRSSVRSGDLAARLGGDEFALVLQPPPQAGTDVRSWAEDVAQRLLRQLSRPVRVAQRTLPGQASVGVAVSESGAVDPDVLLHEADLAMYAAKAAGGSRCVVVDGTSDPSVTTAHAPDRTELHEAVARGQFVVHFQPIVDALTGRLLSTEALVRWQHPARGLLAPVAFLGDVAAAGFAATLDAHVLHLALGQHARWRDEHGARAPEHVNVNLSVPGLLSAELVPTVLDELALAGVAPAALRLELPEVATTAHIAAAAPSLAALRAAGVGLTLDDVGSGAAGLAHLRDLHLDGIKIDRRFVTGMLTDERDSAVVRMLVQMGPGLGVSVTAEGAETQAHLQALREMALSVPGSGLHVQGFAVGGAVPAHELAAGWIVDGRGGDGQRPDSGQAGGRQEGRPVSASKAGRTETVS